MVLDTARDAMQHPVGKYSHVRTGGEGLATFDEFVEVFYGGALGAARLPGFDTLKDTASDPKYVPGTAVTGFPTHDKTNTEGVVANPPFLTVKRTPNLYISGQTSGRAQKFNTYVGNLWLTIDYSLGEAMTRTYVPLFGIHRIPNQETASPHASGVQLVLGAEAVAGALNRR